LGFITTIKDTETIIANGDDGIGTSSGVQIVTT